MGRVVLAMASTAPKDGKERMERAAGEEILRGLKSCMDGRRLAGFI